MAGMVLLQREEEGFQKGGDKLCLEARPGAREGGVEGAAY